MPIPETAGIDCGATKQLSRRAFPIIAAKGWLIMVTLRGMCVD